MTDNGWRSAKTALGNFYYWNPKTKKYEESYGVAADTLVGNLILSKNVGIYNKAGSLTVDENGIVVNAT